jgi:hypothetical protein
LRGSRSPRARATSSTEPPHTPAPTASAPPVCPQSLGQDIILAGLVLQIGFFVAFLALTAYVAATPQVYHLNALPGDGGRRVVGTLLSTVVLMLLRNM